MATSYHGQLDPESRDYFEHGFARDLAHVRIHAHPAAAAAARLLGARAFTVGSDIFFGTNEYMPGSPPGKLLLAHELAHCLQYDASSTFPQPVRFEPDDHDSEDEADRAARSVLRRGRGPEIVPRGSLRIRRAVTIAGSSAVLNVTSGRGSLSASVVAGDAQFSSSWLTANGQVTLLGSPGDSAAGWQLGFIQAQWVETNWAYYRGAVNRDGSVMLQRARPPARARQACRDTVGPVSAVFYDPQPGRGLAVGAAGSFPMSLSVVHSDCPSDNFPLTITNNTTQKVNFLHDAQLEFHFCTVLTVIDPAGRFHHLKHFYWNVRWQYGCAPSSFVPGSVPLWSFNPIAGGNGAGCGPVIDGGPNDRRFLDVLTSPQTQNCNAVFQAAVSTPNRLESSVWSSFDVRR